MNTTNQNNNVTAAPSVTIAPRNPARGVLNFVVTLTTHKDVRSYPCRSLESATRLAERFIADPSRHSPASADVTKPARPASDLLPPASRWPGASGAPAGRPKPL